MITDEKHPQWIAIEKALFEQAMKLANMTGEWNLRAVERIQELADDCTAKARANGVAFPNMIVLYLERQRIVRIYDQEAPPKRIAQHIVILIRELASMGVEFTGQDIATAFRRAFPDYRPEVDATVERKEIDK